MAPRAQLLPSRTSARIDAEHRELFECIQAAIRVALVAWPAFILLDIFVAYVVLPGASLRPLVMYRAFEQALMVFAFYILRPARTARGAVHDLPSGRRILGAEALVFVGSAVMIALMALELGGLRSNYLHGVSIVILVRGAAMPSRWPRTLFVGGLCALAFPGVMAIAALTSSELFTNWTTKQNLAGFASDYVFVLATVILAAVASHTVWAARKSVRASRKLGRYVLKARIGVGGMGEVWHARDDILGRFVALKMLSVRASEQAIARFEREARAASALKDPHTIKVFDFGSDEDGTWFIAMEHLLGANLDSLIREHGAMPPARVLNFARQACASLMEAHEAGIIHRDLKPENLFVTRVGDDYDFLKLLDFGIAKVASAGGDLTHVGLVGGTPRYMPPELWVGGPADARSDVYSLGCTLYMLLAGYPPFRAETLTELAAAHAVKDAPAPSTVRGDTECDALESVVLKCLAKSPADRFQTMRELDDALASCAHDAPWTPDDARLFWTLTRPQVQERFLSTAPPPGLGTTVIVSRAALPPTPRDAFQGL